MSEKNYTYIYKRSIKKEKKKRKIVKFVDDIILDVIVPNMIKHSLKHHKQQSVNIIFKRKSRITDALLKDVKLSKRRLYEYDYKERIDIRIIKTNDIVKKRVLIIKAIRR